MFDNDIYERNEMGLIKSYRDESEETNSFLVKAKFGKTRTIMKNLVEIEDDCIRHGFMNSNRISENAFEFFKIRKCIKYKPFFIGSRYQITHCLVHTVWTIAKALLWTPGRTLVQK